MIYLEHGDKPGHCVHEGGNGECSGWLGLIQHNMTTKCPVCRQVITGTRRIYCEETLIGGAFRRQLKMEIRGTESVGRKNIGMRRWFNEMR